MLQRHQKYSLLHTYKNALKNQQLQCLWTATKSEFVGDVYKNPPTITTTCDKRIRHHKTGRWTGTQAVNDSNISSEHLNDWQKKAEDMAANDSNINSEQFQLLQLSWIERKMAATLFAAPPTASLPEAVQHFLQVFYFDNHLHLFIIIFKLCLQCRPCTPEPSLPPLLCFCHFWALYMYPLFILFFQLASGKAATCP